MGLYFSYSARGGGSVLSQEIGWEERLQNDLFCVDVKRKTLS